MYIKEEKLKSLPKPKYMSKSTQPKYINKHR